jgi:hypothetical protein
MLRRFLLTLPLVLATVPAKADDVPSFEREGRPVLEKFCLSCHNAKRPKAGIDLSKLKDSASLGAQADLSIRVAEALTDRSMPPEGKPSPSEEER